MTPQQISSFAQAAGFQPSTLTFVVRLMVGGFTILCGLIILAGLMRLAEESRAHDKATFVINLFALMFLLMMVFGYIA